MNSLFSHVRCDYTGGNIYVYTALYNDEVWLAGEIGGDFGSYSIPVEEIEEEHDFDYDSFWKNPSVPYPTWNEILDSIRENCDDVTVYYTEKIFDYCIAEMNERCVKI